MATKIASNYSLPIANRYQEISPMYTLYYYPVNASAAPHMLLQEIGADQPRLHWVHLPRARQAARPTSITAATVTITDRNIPFNQDQSAGDVQ
jgi:hypothetical protein